MRPTTDRSSVSIFLMSHRNTSSLPFNLSKPVSYKKSGFLAIKTLAFLALGLVVFLAGCSYGPTGIFAGVELERRTASFSVGLPVVNVQRIAVSDDGTRAAVSGARLYVRAGSSPTSGANTNWNRVNLPSGFTNSLDVGITDDGTIYAVLIGDSGTRAFTKPDGGSWATVNIGSGSPQGVLQAGDDFYFVVKNDDGTYRITENDGTTDTYLIDLTAFPSKAVIAGNTHVLTSNGVFEISDTNSIFTPSGETLTGMTALSGGEIAISTAQGNIYISNLSQVFTSTPINSSPIQVGNTTVKFTDLIYIGSNTLVVGSQGFGYFVINTTNGNATRAINRDLSNLLDTPLYNKTVSTFAYVGPANDPANTNLYLGAPGEGVFFGTRTGNFIQWNPLQE
jgi:hypothetical protein